MASASCIGPDSGRRRGEGTPEPPPRPLLNPQPKLSPKTPDRASPHSGVCYTCKQGGHWSKDCPSKESASRTPFRVDGGRMETPECPCGAGPSLQLTSHTDKNPGREFFRCPVKSPNERCRFFQWCDSTSPYQPHGASPAKRRLNLGTSIEQQARNTPQQDDCHPLCQCGAGWCIILEVKEGEHIGRKYFSCPRKKILFGLTPEWQHMLDLISKSCAVIHPPNSCTSYTLEVNKEILTTLSEEDPNPDYSSWPSRFSRRGRDRDSREILTRLLTMALACSDERCNFRQWCVDFDVTGKSMEKPVNQDLVIPLSNTVNIQYPFCPCGAGSCRLLTMEHGEYAGRKYFGCTVKKGLKPETASQFVEARLRTSSLPQTSHWWEPNALGQGACNFFQWQNAAEGEHSSGKNNLVGYNHQHPDSVTKPRSLFNVEPNLVNFDNMVVGGTSVEPSPTLERREAGGLLNQNQRTSSHNISLGLSPKQGKCYRCGREGHWVIDCVGPLPPPQM